MKCYVLYTPYQPERYYYRFYTPACMFLHTLLTYIRNRITFLMSQTMYTYIVNITQHVSGLFFRVRGMHFDNTQRTYVHITAIYAYLSYFFHRCKNGMYYTKCGLLIVRYRIPHNVIVPYILDLYTRVVLGDSIPTIIHTRYRPSYFSMCFVAPG